MLTEERLEQLKNEVALRGRGMDPVYTPLHEEADSYQYVREPEKEKPLFPAESSSKSGNGPLDNINSAISSPTSTEDIRKYESMLEAEGELTTFREPKIDLSLEGFVRDTEQMAKGIASSMDSFRASKLYANLFYGKDELQERIHKISKATGINESLLMGNDDVYQHGEKLLQQLEKYEKLPSLLKTDGTLDMQKVYKEMPYLKILQEKHGDVTAAMALSNAKGLMTINDVYKNEAERFAASVGFGLNRGWNNLMRQWTYGKAMIRGLRGRDGHLKYEEQKEIDRLNAENAQTPDYSYSSFGSGLGAMIGGAAENLPMIFSSQGVGKVAGAAAGAATFAITKNATAAAKAYSWVSNAVGIGVMGLEIGAGQYEQNLYKLDKNGKLMYTPQQAAAVSLLQGVSEGALEQYSLNQIGRAIFGGKELIPLAELWKKAPELAATEGMKTAEEATRKFIADKIADAAKTHMVIFRNELQEEFTQQVSDMVIENMAQVVLRGDQAELSSVGEILTESLGAAMQAVPSIMGFSLIGGGLNPVANAKSVIGARNHVRNMMQNNILYGAMANAHYNSVLSGVWANKDNIKELHDKTPEAEKTILDAQNKIAGMEYGFVDVKTLAQQEGGRELVQQIADKAGISAEELADCMNGSGMLQVKTSALMQMDLQDAQQKAVQDNVTASLDSVTAMQFKELLDIAKGQEESLKKFDDETYKKAVDNIIAARFQDKDQAKLAREIIEANYDNPQAEFKRRLDAVNAEIMEEIGPILHELESGMGQGTTLVRDAEGNPTGARVSNNDLWYSNYFADYGRAPSREWMIDNAIRIASGRQDPRYGLVDYQNNTEESRAGFAPIAEKLDRLVEQRDALNAIKDRMQQLKAGEITATATLSPEGLKVYDAAIRLMGTSENKEVQKVGRYNALFVARYADRMAKVFSRVKQKPYTAIDYVRDYLKIDVNAVQGELQNAAQYNQEENHWEVAKTEKEAWNILKRKGVLGKTIENSATSDKAVVGSETIRRCRDTEGYKQAKEAGIPSEDYFSAWANIEELFRNAKEYSYKRGNQEKHIDYYGLYSADFKEFNVVIEVRYTYQDGNRIKELSIKEIKKAPPIQGRMTSKTSLSGTFSNEIISLVENLSNSYISKFVKNTLDEVQDVSDIVYDRLAILEELKNIALEIGAEAKPLNKTTPSGYYVLDGKTVRLSNHKSKRKADRQDWDNEFLVTDQNIDEILSNIKSREELKDFVKGLFSETAVPYWQNYKFNALMQTAYHGTGSRFEKFSTDFMGTGEGAQAHGWGLYFAKDREIAEGYRNQMVYDEIQYRLSQLDPRSKEYSIMQQVLEFASETLLGTDPDTVIADAEEDGGYDPEAIKRFKENKIGQVFEADVPEDDVLLDEQKRIDKQPEFVQQAIEKMLTDLTANSAYMDRFETGDNYGKSLLDDLSNYPEISGKRFYEVLVRIYGSPKAASLKLNEYGVKGITYEGGTDGRCFVVFDDNAISIMQKFYQRSLTADEKLMETSKLWNGWLEQVEHEGVEKYASKHGQEFFDFMDVPLVLQFFGIPYKKIKVQGNFVYHSLRVNKHPGMKMEYLKQLPEAMANPWMITRGKNGRYTFVLQLKDKYGATIVVPVAIDKNVSRYGIAEPLDVAESAYGKTEEDNKTPDYMWLVGEKGAIAEDRILYINKQSTRKFAEAVRVSYPLADQLSSALSELIISAEAGNIKTEEDLAAYKAEHPSMYQQQSRLKGSIAIGERGRRIISLFEGADQSTFMHEMAHLFLLDLQEIAGIDSNGREAKDLKTIMDWAQYRPGQSDEYKGTSSEAEFRKREEAIKAAVAAGNMAEAERLKDEWMQERFARGFEEYLRSGEAPAMGLKRAFRQLKKWLVQIYHDVTGAGVRATPEVEAVMARMVASEEEIEALAAANNIDRLRKLDPDILSDDMDAMHDRWQEEAKEKAKEKLLRELMKQYQQQNLKDLDKKLEAFREETQRALQETPCFICEELLNQGNSMDIALEICEFTNEQEYREALDAAGGSLRQAVDREVALERQRMLEQMPGREVLYDMAEEALHSGNYDARLSVLEAEMLEVRKKSYDDLPKKVQAAFSDLDGALGDLKKESWEEVKKKIRGLKYATRWQAKEYAMIREFEDAAAKLENPEDREAVERLRAEYERIKQQVTRNKEWVRGVRDATQGQFLAIKNRAQREMDKQPISVATNPRHWRRLGLQEGRTAWKELGKAQGKGEKNGTLAYSNAVGAKVQQALFDAMTSIAFENRKELDKMLNGRDGIYNRARRMADPKYKADATMRYFHNHILYIMGLRNTDAIAPAQEKTFTELLAELRQAQEFDEEIPAWMIQLAEAKQPLDKNYQTLTMDEFRQLKKLTDILYTLARNKNRLLTLDMDMDTVRAEMVAGYESHTDYEVGNQRINEIKGDIGDMMNSLLKPEAILSILGGKDGPFVKYIYRILYSAAEAEEKALEQEAKAEKALYGMYTHEELRAMVNDPIMVEGKDGTKTKLQIGADTDITKEHLICMALNRGNKLNWARLVVGLFDSQTNADMEIHGNELMQILQTHLTKKDWTFVQAMWDHIGTFADPVSGVMEKSLGVPLDRVKADAFTVTLPDGETLKMQGGYYPIVKDSGKSSRQSEFEQMEEAKAIGGASVFGAGMGATKNRSDNEKLNQGPLKLSLDVASRHIKAQIHLVHARMAVRDAYKVLNDASVKDMIERACGTDTFKMLNEYVLNCWAPPIQPHHWLEKYAAKLRGKTVSAIMGYRTMTALLNTLPNVVYMAQEIGTGNALAALADFYKDWRTNRNIILDTSVFMRNRATNMDRDLDAQQEKFLNRHEGRTGKLVNAIDKVTGGKTTELDYLINKYANKLIEETDMMVSMPLYKWQFNQTYSEEIAKGVPAEEALETANFEATRRVTKVFGSSRAVDTSAVQRSRNEFVKLLTPFFTFANTMMNAVWSKHFEQKLQGKNFGNEKIALRDSKGNVLLDEEGNIRYTTEREQSKLLFRYRYGKFVRAMLMNYLLGALVETWMRQLPDALAGTGDDDDDEFKFAKESAKNVISGAAAGFPGINMMADMFNTYAIEGKMYGNRGVGVVSGSVDRYFQVGKDLLKLTKGSDKIDVLDLVRDCVKATNTRTGFSDTLTDAIFNTARFAVDDYQLNNPDDLREYIAKSLFDRKLKKRD